MHKSKVNILLAEDEPNFGAVLKSYLNLNEYEVCWCKDGKEAYSKLNAQSFDLCILDVMMPEMDGFTLAKEIRKKDEDIPMIFLTAKNDKSDMLYGFKLGADDYLTKPFDSEILMEKIKVLLKRKVKNGATKSKEEKYRIGEYEFFTSTRKLIHSNETRVLSPKESALLTELCIQKNQVLTREEALVKIWGEDNYFTARSMDVYVAKLRKYLKADASIQIINIHGNGFQLSIQSI